MTRLTVPLGILAGGGRLPGQVAAAARAAGRDVFMVGLEGFADPGRAGALAARGAPHRRRRRGSWPRCATHGCQDLVLIGPVRRPSLLDLRPDAEGARMLARIGRAAFAGDDGLLAAVVRVLGEEGFRVLGAHEILSEALGPRGLLSRAAPGCAAMADIARGVAVARALGAVDVGQGCVVQQGIVLAVEAAEGTDAMLAALRRAGAAGAGRRAGEAGQAGAGSPRRPADHRPGTIRARARRPACAGLPSRPAAPFLPTATPPSRRRTRPGFFCWALTRMHCPRGE